MRKRLFWLLVLSAALGCSGAAKSPATKTSKTAGGKQGGPKTPAAVGGYARLMPAETVLYYRLKNAKKVVAQLIQPKHVKDAAKVRQQFNSLLFELTRTLGNNPAFGVSLGSLTSMVFDIEAVYVGMTLPEGGSAVPGFVAVIVTKNPKSLNGAERDIAKAATTKLTGRTKLLIKKPEGGPAFAVARLDATTLVLGTESAVTSGLKRKQGEAGNSLADSAAYRQAMSDWRDDGELFVYADLKQARSGLNGAVPFSSISHAATSLRIDGGLSIRAYAADGSQFPEFLARTPSERKFLSRIPADAAFILGAGTQGGKETRKNFVEWVMEELGQEPAVGTALLPERWRKLAATYAKDPDSIENGAFAVIGDIWAAALPVRSESAFFIAEDANGRWGTAFLFDIEDKQQITRLRKAVFETKRLASLPWKTTKHEGLTIRYLDFVEISKAAGKPIDDALAKQAQLQVGYAEGKELFFVGTLEAIKFAHKPTGKTLNEELAYDNLDAKNAILLSLQPGRVLHRTFGVPQVDRVLKAFASQIPEDSNYAVTLNFTPKQLTLKTNIPFVSLFIWLAM